MATETEVCNLALGKLGGAGDALGGNAFITDIDDDDKVSSWCNLVFPRIRRRVITDLAVAVAPFRSTVRFASLSAELAAANLPETGNWEHAFNLPVDTLAVVCQFDEENISLRRQSNAYTTPITSMKYQWEMIANKDASGMIFLTDNLTDADQESAFIEYVIDTPNVLTWNEEMIDCVATLLASEVAPIIGRDMESSQLMLAQYLSVALPKAKQINKRGFDNRSRGVPNFKGGRSEGRLTSSGIVSDRGL